MHECEVYDQNNAELCGYIARRQMFHKNKRVNGGTITPRDAFFGGRTNNIWQFYEVNNTNEDIETTGFLG